MPILGLTSGKEMKLSQKQYEALMSRREAMIGGLMMEVYDEEKAPLGKVRTDSIEYIVPDNSLLLTDHSPSSSGVYECSICGKVFSHKSSLSRHKAREHKE